MPPTQKTIQTPKPSGYDPATLLVQLMNELQLDIGPESQHIIMILPTYDTYAYVLTTFAVNGYEVRTIDSINYVQETKHCAATIKDDGWTLSLSVYNVPLTQGEIEAAAEADDSSLVAGGGSDEREWTVPGLGVSSGARGTTSRSPRPAGKRAKRIRADDGIRLIGEIKA